VNFGPGLCLFTYLLTNLSWTCVDSFTLTVTASDPSHTSVTTVRILVEVSHVPPYTHSHCVQGGSISCHVFLTSLLE